MRTCTGIRCYFFIYFFNDTATTEIYTLSLHDALPISLAQPIVADGRIIARRGQTVTGVVSEAKKAGRVQGTSRSEEHTSELQSHLNLVCRLLLEKKNTVLIRAI